MSSVDQITRARRIRRQRFRSRSLLPYGSGCSGLFSLLVGLASISLAIAYAGLSRGLPSLDALPALLDPPHGLLLEPTRLYDRSGEHELFSLENPAAEGRTALRVPRQDEETSQGSTAPGTRIAPSTLITATIAAADPGFWEHAGFSFSGVWSGAHPTLAQSLVSGLLLPDEPPGLRRALRERLLAAQLTSRYGREKILEWTLNYTGYGNLAYGADAAARVYFNKPASRLNLAESALLATVAQAPALNPLDAPQAARERQLELINRMEATGLITPRAAQQARQTKVVLRPPVAPPPQPAPAYVRLVLQQLEAHFDRKTLERGGLRVITSLDYELQLQSACAAATQMARLGNPQAEGVDFAGHPCQAERLLPTLPPRSLPASEQEAALLTDANAQLVILDPQTGEILALVGEDTPGRAPLPPHPAGSILTPFIYLTGFTRGLGPASLLWDVPAGAIAGQEGTAIIAEANLDGEYHGPVRLRAAAANDYLAPAFSVLAQVGTENAWRTARQMGILSLQQAGPSRPFSQLTVTLLETVQAYGVLAAEGSLAGKINAAEASSARADPDEPAPIQPVAVLEVSNLAGHILWERESVQKRPVITPQLAYLMTHVLSDEAARWPSLGHPNPLEIGRPVAAKTGRTLSGSDQWTVGYTPQVVVGVWTGYPAPEAAGQSPWLPSNLAAGLWHAVMQYTTRQMPSQAWSPPPGVSVIPVCDPSGLLPTSACPNIVNEVFLNGSEPTQADTLYQTIQVNRETGRLATIFTPLDLVEERVYLVAPAEAQEWARQAGLDVPPEEWDTLTISSVAPATSSSSPGQILTPAQFAAVSGKVKIQGSVQKDSLAYYRLQVGQGLNPPDWFQVSEDASLPVASGLLGEWDTAGLEGLYSIKLLIVQSDQRIYNIVVPVTVDNQPPDVRILYPLAGQALSAPAGSAVTLRVEALDNLGIQSAEYWLDGQKMATLFTAPFSLPWSPEPGTHTLAIRVVDRAGNASQDEVEFHVTK